MSVSAFSRIANGVRVSGKWALAFLCVFALALAVTAAQPREAWAGAEYADCGPNLSTQIGGDPLEVSIAKKKSGGSGYMYDWSDTTKGTRPWASSQAEIGSVVLGSGVASIGSYAFYDCSKMKTITIPKTVSSVGAYAFTNCVVLDEVVWDGTKAEWETFKANKVASEGNGFLLSSHVKLLKAAGQCADNIAWTLDLDGVLTVFPKVVGNPASIEDCAGYATGPWYALRDEVTEIVIEEGVTSVGSNAFCMMSNLASVKFPDGLKSIGYNAFYECTSLLSVTIPASVELIDGSFNGCSSLRSAFFLGEGAFLGERTFTGSSPGFVVTGYASTTRENGIYKSPAYYCHTADIPFRALNGDMGWCTLDFTKGVQVLYTYPEMDVKGYALEAMVASIGTQPSVVVNGWNGIDLDGDGNDDIRLEENEYATCLEVSRADSCSVGGTVVYELTDGQQIQAASNTTYGYYYSSVLIELPIIPLDDCKMSPIKAQTYSGKALEPTVTLKYGDYTLKPGLDYTVEYTDNVSAGTATMMITGKGACVGSKTALFAIDKAKPSAQANKPTVKVKYAKVKKAAQAVSNLTVVCDDGKASYKNASSGAAKKFKVNAKTGKVTVPKGTQKGAYKLKVKVTVKPGANYKKLAKIVPFKVKVA